MICSEAGLGNLLQLGAMAITANRGFSLPIFSLMLIICPFLVGCRLFDDRLQVPVHYCTVVWQISNWVSTVYFVY